MGRHHTLDTTAGDPKPGTRAPGQGLRPDQTFVVQLREAPAGAGRELVGRVEHVVSGEVLRFRSTAELVAFLHRGDRKGRP